MNGVPTRIATMRGWKMAPGWTRLLGHIGRHLKAGGIAEVNIYPEPEHVKGRSKSAVMVLRRDNTGNWRWTRPVFERADVRLYVEE